MHVYCRTRRDAAASHSLRVSSHMPSILARVTLLTPGAAAELSSMVLSEAATVAAAAALAAAGAATGSRSLANSSNASSTFSLANA